MPSLNLVAVEGGTGSGSWTIPVAQMSAVPNLSNITQSTNQYDGKVYVRARSTTPTQAQFLSGGMAIPTDMPTGYYWIGGVGSGIQINIGMFNDPDKPTTKHGFTFGPIKVWGSIYGSATSQSGSAYYENGLVGVVSWSAASGDMCALCYCPNPDSALPAPGYYMSYAFGFDGLGDIINGGDSPYRPPSGQAGSDSAAGGSSAGGAGYPTGTNAGIPESKKDRANVGCDIYQCSAAAIRAFTKMLWGSTDAGFISAFFERVQNTVYNPINAVITCHSLPSAFAVSGGTATGIKAGGVDFSTYSAACVGSPVNTEWSSSALYTFTPLEECWGNYSDYSKMSVALYLPFCGVVPLDSSSILGKNGSGGGGIAVQYWCNILNGNCAAFVCGWDREGDYKILKIATGNCAQPCPISGNDRGMAQKLGALVGFAQGMTSIGSQVASQGGSAILTGNMGGLPTTPSILGKYASNGITSASQFLTAAQHTSVVGSLNGAAGFAASTQIILMLDYGIPVESPNYTSIRARPSEVSGTVSSFSGYCEIEVHADSIPTATDFEKREIERLCAEGVIV